MVVGFKTTCAISARKEYITVQVDLMVTLIQQSLAVNG
jgi:hypothetical protein